MRKQEIQELLDFGDTVLLRRDLNRRREVFVAEELDERYGKTVVIGRWLYAEAGRHERFDHKIGEMVDAVIPPSIGEYRTTLSPRDLRAVWYREGNQITEQEWRDDVLADLNREFEEQRPSGWSRTDLNLALEDSGRPSLSNSALRDLPNSVVALLCELLEAERAR